VSSCGVRLLKEQNNQRATFEKVEDSIGRNPLQSMARCLTHSLTGSSSRTHNVGLLLVGPRRRVILAHWSQSSHVFLGTPLPGVRSFLGDRSSQRMHTRQPHASSAGSQRALVRLA